MESVVPLFTRTVLNDRAGDYSVSSPASGCIIVAGASHVFNVYVDVSLSALTNVPIRLDAAVGGYRLDNDEGVSDSTAAVPDTWIVLAEHIQGFAALYDSRLTSDRSDDSLIARVPLEIFCFNEAHYLHAGAPIADIPFETGAAYRLVFQINSSRDWDYEPKLSGKGFCALAGPPRGFGRASAPIEGVPELLLTDSLVADEFMDSIDVVVGTTKKAKTPQQWSMVSDPQTDPIVDIGKTAETGSLANALPAGAFVDCIDAGETWEVTGNCEKDRYYFYELWFQSDLEWESGDTADAYLRLEGKPAPTNLEQLHVLFRLVDEDTIPPVFSDFSPEIVRAGESFSISCRITDASGVYDDGTGSSGQGIYLLWDDDGSLADGANETRMSASGGGYYVTDIQIGSHNEGDVIVYSVHACDDDADGGKTWDRTRGASDVHTVQIMGAVYLLDEPGSLYPAEAYAGEGNVSIHLDLNNPNMQELVLYKTSTVSFSDGMRVVAATLRNETPIPAGASHFPVSFEATQVPSDFSAPDVVDLTLDLVGLYNALPFSQTWIASEGNRFAILKPRLLVAARPVPGGAVHPGDAAVELMRIEVTNDSPSDVVVDSLVVANATAGGGGVPLNDADFDRLYLYAQSGAFAPPIDLSGDSLEKPVRELLPTDRLLASALFVEGEARLRFPAAEPIPAGATGYWFVVGDIDTFLASDGDSLDVAIAGSDSVFVTGDASVELVETPLNSDGTSMVDGFVSLQLSVEELRADTLYLGDADQPVLSFVPPVDGHMPAVLSAVSIKNYGDVEVNDLVERLVLWRDDGDGLFSSSSDHFAGALVATGDRFELTGLSLTMLAPQRFFVAADFGLGTHGVLEARFGIPAGGIECSSGNDGPIDRDVAPDSGQVLLRREIVTIDALPVPAGTRYAGERDVELLAIRIGNNTLGGVTVDSLRVRGKSALFPCEPGKVFALRADDGDESFEPDVDTVFAEAAWSGGAAFFPGMGIAIAPGAQRVLYVATGLDSFLTVDGETLSVGVESTDDIDFTLAPSVSDELFRIEADFPLVSAGGGVTDGMLAHQVTFFSHGDSVIVEQRENILVLDLLVPGNACNEDTLESLTVMNLGTAGSKHIERFLLWRDNGDGLFDPLADQSVAMFGETTARTYAAQDLSEPLAGLAGGRFFVTMDIFENVETGGTVDLVIPVMGIGVASGNDGPVDSQLDGPGIFTIPVPDRVTLFTSILGNKRVLPGESDALNLVLGMYNSYDDPKTLRRLVLLSVGSSGPGEITRVAAYADADENGLFNPAIDSLLEVASASEAGYSFEKLGAVLKPYRSTLLFISYGTALAGIRDSIRIDLQVSDKASIVFQGAIPVIEGDFPLNSAGVDITNGMVNAQVRMLPVPDARVSPGAVDIPCLSVALPCNGTVEDLLESISIQNTGSALQGQDIRYVKLWKDSGSAPLAFDAGDAFLAFLVWDGSSWKTVSPLEEPIPCEGLVLHVTADIASTAQDGRTVGFCLPVDGVLVASGNDGPIDRRACVATSVEITTDPLIASFAVPAAVTCEQIFEVRMNASNVGDSTLHGVEPDSFAFAGTASCSIISGPAPASIDLPGKSDSSFVWTVKALSAGELAFRGRLKEGAGSEASRLERSDTVRVDEIPQNVAVTARDLAPVSLNRGQEDIALIEMTIAYNHASGHGAPVAFTAIELSTTNGAGAPLSVKDVVSRVRIRDEIRVLCSMVTDAIEQTSMICRLQEPVILLPGVSKTFRISVDISTVASAADFKLSIASAGALALVDDNSGAPVPFSGTAFPWSTSEVILRDAASALLVRLVSTAPADVNMGQRDVSAFDLVLENGGSSAAAPVSVSSFVFTAMDANGDTIDAGKLFKAFRLAGSGGNTYAYVEAFAGSASIRCDLQPAVNVAPQVPVTLQGMIDCLLEPAASGFSLSLRDSLDVAARDANSGQPVEVLAAPGSPGFPMNTDVSVFHAPLSRVAVQGWGLMEERIMAGTANAPAIRLILSHPGAAQESPYSCRGITVRLLDELGAAIKPIDMLGAVRVRKAGMEIASVYVTALHTSDIPLSFAAPLVTPPGGADTLDVMFDLIAAPARPRLQMHVNMTGIDVVDATDGRSGIPLVGSFPLASGVGTVMVPAGDMLFGADGLLPANVAAGTESPCMRLIFTRQDASAASRVLVEGFTLEALDENDQMIDPSLVVAALRVDGESGAIPAAWQAVDGRIEVALSDPPAVGENATFACVLSITSAAHPPVKALSLRVFSSGAIRCRDEETGGAVAVVPGSGAFPFNSGKAAILAQDVEASFSNYPNPFVAGTETTRIVFYMPDRGNASLRVFTVAGEPVRAIIENELLAAGLHQEFTWDGKNGRGNTVLNGVYFLVLKISAGGRDYSFKRKVALVQ